MHCLSTVLKSSGATIFNSTALSHPDRRPPGVPDAKRSNTLIVGCADMTSSSASTPMSPILFPVRSTATTRILLNRLAAADAAAARRLAASAPSAAVLAASSACCKHGASC